MERKKKQYNPNNCDTCVRGVYYLDYRTKVIISGQYAHKWSINIVKTIYGKETVERHEFSNGNAARKALNYILRKTKPNQLK